MCYSLHGLLNVMGLMMKAYLVSKCRLSLCIHDLNHFLRIRENSGSGNFLHRDRDDVILRMLVTPSPYQQPRILSELVVCSTLEISNGLLMDY